MLEFADFLWFDRLKVSIWSVKDRTFKKMKMLKSLNLFALVQLTCQKSQALCILGVCVHRSVPTV